MSSAILKHIESKESDFVEVLREAIAIKSVSNEPKLRSEVFRMADWLKSFIKQYIPDSEVELVDNVGTVEAGDPKLPPLVAAKIGKHVAGKKTLLIYAHYDVQPALKSDGWEQEDPFVLEVLEDGRMRGRGSTDDKGPLVGWLNLFKSMVELKEEFPVNIRLISEGMEESGSEGFYETAEEYSKKSDFFKGVDFCCISDNYWLSTKKPCVTYGLRGLCAVSVSIAGPKMDLHSGMFGGQVYHPMDDLVYLFSTLKERSDKSESELIKIPGVYDQVAPITEEERKLYDPIFFSIEDKKKEIAVSKLRNESDKTACLMSIWRQPSLTIHGIEGAVDGPGFKTAIPRHIIGKFSIRTVPNMQPEQLESAVRAHLEREFAKLKSPNTMTIKCDSGPWWYADPTTPVFQAAKRATAKVYQTEPDFTREGGSIPITGLLGKLTGVDVCLIPMGRSDDGAHAQNEKLDKANYINGTKLFAAFLQELAL